MQAADDAEHSADTGLWIVTLRAPSVPAKREAGKPFDPHSARATADEASAEAQQRRVAARHGVEVVRHLAFALNGFIARMTRAQAAQMSADPDVLRVEADQLRRLHLSRQPRDV